MEYSKYTVWAPNAKEGDEMLFTTNSLSKMVDELMTYDDFHKLAENEYFAAKERLFNEYEFEDFAYTNVIDFARELGYTVLTKGQK